MRRSLAVSGSEARGFGISVTLHLGFVLTGIVTTLLGPLLPVLSAKWNLLDFQAGYLFTSQFVGSMAGVGLSSVLTPRLGFRRTLALGFALVAIGLTTLDLSTWMIGLASVFGYGMGLGLTIPTTNLLVAELYAGRRAAALNILNFAWGIGAAGCPALAALAFRAHHMSVFFFSLVAATAFVVFSIFRNAWIDTKDQPPAVEAARSGGWRVLPLRLIGVLAVLFFFYVGAENSLSGWAATYAKRLSLHAGTVWMLVPSCFWAALLLGRAVAPALLRHLADVTLMVLGLLLAACGIAVVVGASTLFEVFLGVTISGLGMASVFPIAIAALSHYLGVTATRVGGAMFALGGLGGATLPWLVGFLSTKYESLRLGLAVPLVSVLVMIGMQLTGWGFPIGERFSHEA